MSSRRSFIGNFLAFIGVAAAPAIATAKPVLPDDLEKAKDKFVGDSEVLRYKGFRLFWTGWKNAYPNDIDVGQWCAYEGLGKYDSNGRHFYASYPGSQGRYYPGQIFDISIYPGQMVTTMAISETDKIVCKLDAFRRLIALIDAATKF